MGFRFRKSVSLGPMRLNLSKSGIGMSAGVPGARIGINRRGTYGSVGIPGTRIHSTSHLSNPKSRGSSDTSRSTTAMASVHDTTVPSRLIKTKTRSALFWIGLVDLILLVINPGLGLIAIALTLVWYFFYLKRQPSFQARRSLRSAQTALAARDYETAATHFESAYNFFSTDKAIALLAASSYSLLGQFKKSTRLLEEYLASYPEDVEMQKVLACWHQRLGNEDRALQILQALNIEEAREPGTLLLMAKILSHKGLDSAAIEVLKRAPLRKRTLTPDLAEVVYTLGLLYEKNGNNKRARSLFERVYAYDSSFKDVAGRVTQ